MYSMTWARKLIDLVKQYPELYNPQHENYKDVHSKMKIWNKIAKELHMDNAELARSKWRNFRDTMNKYLRNANRKNGKSQVAKWPWAKHMEFLVPYLSNKMLYNQQQPQHCESILMESNISGTKEEQEGREEDEEEEDAGEALSYHRSMDGLEDGSSTDNMPLTKRHTIEEDEEEIITKSYKNSSESFENYLNDYMTQETDPNELLFLSYAKTLKKFSKMRQIEVKMEMAKIMFEAERQQILEEEKFF